MDEMDGYYDYDELDEVLEGRQNVTNRTTAPSLMPSAFPTVAPSNSPTRRRRVRRTPSEIMFAWSPAWGLTATLFAPLVLIALWRWGRRLRASIYKRRLRQDARAVTDEGAEDDEDDDLPPVGKFLEQSDLALPWHSAEPVAPSQPPQARRRPRKLEVGKSMQNRAWVRFTLMLAKRLPGTQVSVFQVLVVLGISVATVWWVYGFPGRARPAKWWGSVAASLMLFTVVPATRNSVLTWFLFEPFERTVFYHRWLGRLTLVASWVHTVYYVIQRDYTWIDLVDNRRNLTGTISLIAFTVLTFSSFHSIRRHSYNLFVFLHLSYLPAIGFGAAHVKEMIPFAVGIGILFGTDLLVRALLGLVPQRPIEMAVLPDGVTRLRVAKSRLKSYRAGQYVFINVPGLTPMWHPYTISSGPHEPALEVHIKALGDHTIQLHNMIAKLGPDDEPPRVRVDGPYGRIAFNYRRYETVVLISGGVGVTPNISVLRDIFQLGLPEHSVAKRPGNIRRVHFLWAVRSMDSLGWFLEALEDAQRRADAGGDWPSLSTTGFLSRPANDDEQPVPERVQMRRSRMQPKMELDLVLEGLDTGPERVAVLACGPSGLVNAAWDACRDATKRGPHQVDFHFEHFDF